jgi:hypothetical protein
MMNHIEKLPDGFRQVVEKIDWCKFAHEAINLLGSLGKPYYIKQDLVKWLEDH